MMSSRLYEKLSPMARELIESVETLRREAGARLVPERRSALGQFMTPAAVSLFMASLIPRRGKNVRLLDAGAAVGSLAAAAVAHLVSSKRRPARVHVVAYEIEPVLVEYLKRSMKLCGGVCQKAGTQFSYRIQQEDFIEAGVSSLAHTLFPLDKNLSFDCAILNPPYRKIRSDSETRRLLRLIGVETSNLYTAFLSVAVKLLSENGELVAITPRSFCNGPYFRPFRELLLREMRLKRIHVFHARNKAFREDEVLQENVIYRVSKGGRAGGDVEVSANAGPEDAQIVCRRFPYVEIVRPQDPQRFIHLPVSDEDESVIARMRQLDCTLADLDLEVSTGRVVDFRARSFIRERSEPGTVPLVYPAHLKNGFVVWPNNNGRKPSAIADCPDSSDLLVPEGSYVLVKRFSAKEERRRVSAAVYDPRRILAERVGFENHLNYFHRHRKGLPKTLAKGLAAFLNSTLVDLYFRQFSGHTQVNATDLRSIPYPSAAQLKALGARIRRVFPGQERVDHLVDELLP